MNKRKKQYFLVVIFASVIFLIIAYLTVSDKYYNKKNKEHFTYFDSSMICGRLEYIGGAYLGSTFKILGIAEKYVFYPNTGTLNDFEIFDLIASIGDSVYKPAYCDTLKLIKKEREYLYTFTKYEE